MKSSKTKWVKLSSAGQVTLRARQNKHDFTLVLDFKANGIRKQEYLKIRLSTIVKKRMTDLDRNALALAEQILLKRSMEIANDEYDLQNTNNNSFVLYLLNYIDNRINNNDKQTNKLLGLKKHYLAFNQREISFKQMRPTYIDEFKQFLLKQVSPITARGYYSIFCQSIKQAKINGLIKTNPCNEVKKIPTSYSQRTFLTLDEVTRLHNTDNPHPDSKRAFLFACFSGLRYADVVAMKWSQIERNGDGVILHFQQQKTGRWEMMYLADQAVEYLGDPKGDDDLVFAPLSKKRLRLNLIKWSKDAGIKKHVTFHVARHTFATMALNLGVDLKTVSKLLGHSEIKTTEIYAKILDKTKQEAVKKLPRLQPFRSDVEHLNETGDF
jgi:integrase